MHGRRRHPTAPTAAADTCAPITKTYTTDPDFNLGTLNGVVTNSNQLELSTTTTTWPYAWIANAEGTISKVNTNTGDEVGRYYTGPPDNSNSFIYLSPSRTVIDRDGNCWVANRTAGAYCLRDSDRRDGRDDRNNNSNIETSTDLNSDGDCADPGKSLRGVWTNASSATTDRQHADTPRAAWSSTRPLPVVGLSQTTVLHKLNPNLPIGPTAEPPPTVAPNLRRSPLPHPWPRLAPTG